MEMPSSPARAVRRAKSSALPSSGLQRHVPARLAADGPGAARVGAPRGRRVVAALAVRQPDRVDGRQVEHVEAQLARTPAAASRPRRSRPTSAGRARTRSRTRRARNPPGSRASRRRPSARSDRRRPPPGPPRPSGDATPSRAAPSESSLARSLWPAATLRSSSCCQEATRSTHATTPNCQRPSASALEGPVPAIEVLGQPPHRQPRASGACPGARKRSAPPSTSCPSRRNVAHTSTRSPTVRLAG